VKLQNLAFLADENIHPTAIDFLLGQGLDVHRAVDLGLAGKADEKILAYGHQHDRAILTHDSDFGTLAIAQHAPAFGIVYLRPANIDPTFTIQSLTTLLMQEIEVQPGFIIVARRADDQVRIRIRQLPSPA